MLRLSLISLTLGLGLSMGLVAQSNAPLQTHLQGRKLLESKLEVMQADELLSDDLAHEWLSLYDALASQPLDIRTATLEELMTLPLMHEYLAYQLIRYRTQGGYPLRSLSDLKLIEGWDDEAIKLYRPLITLGAKPLDGQSGASPRLRDATRQGKSTADVLLHRPYLQDKRKTEEYLGSPWGLQIRYLWSNHYSSAMLAAERDSYEPWQRGKHKGFDSYAGHIALKDIGIIHRLIAGDYRVSWGEGLILHQGFGRAYLSSGYNTYPLGIKPVQTTSEGNKSRGIAGEIDLSQHLRLTALYSNRLLDGRIDEETALISGLSEAGLHRTETEWERRHNIRMRHYGGQLAYHRGRILLAISALRYDWGGLALKSATGASYNTDLEGITQHCNYSLSYHWSNERGNAQLSGEVARSNRQGVAVLQRLGYRSSDYGIWHIALRHISKGYWSYFGQSQTTHFLRPSAEQGIGIGWRLPELLPRLDLALEADLFRSLAERRSGQAQGAMYRALLNYATPSGHRLTLQFRHQQIRGIGTSYRTSLRYIHQANKWTLTPSLALGRNKRENTTLSSPLAYSIGLRADYRLSQALRLSASAVSYSVENWADRQYWSEPRLSRQFSSAFLYGKGYRLTCLAQGKLSKHLALGIQFIHHKRKAPHHTQSQLAIQLSGRW